MSPTPSPPSCPGPDSSALPCSLTLPAPGSPLERGEPRASRGRWQPPPTSHTADRKLPGNAGGPPGSTCAHCQWRDRGTGVGVAWAARPCGGPLCSHPHRPGGGVGPVLPGKGRLSRSLESVKQEESGSAHTPCPAPARATPLRSPAGTWQGWLGRAPQGRGGWAGPLSALGNSWPWCLEAPSKLPAHPARRQRVLLLPQGRQQVGSEDAPPARH